MFILNFGQKLSEAAKAQLPVPNTTELNIEIVIDFKSDKPITTQMAIAFKTRVLPLLYNMQQCDFYIIPAGSSIITAFIIAYITEYYDESPKMIIMTKVGDAFMPTESLDLGGFAKDMCKVSYDA